jgi:hypothetical protein
MAPHLYTNKHALPQFKPLHHHINQRIFPRRHFIDVSPYPHRGPAHPAPQTPVIAPDTTKSLSQDEQQLN